jgi:Spy/CpxP family protein refolding chaperone
MNGDLSWRLTTSLVMNESVHRELDINDRQAEDLTRIARTLRRIEKDSTDIRKIQNLEAAETVVKSAALHKHLKVEVDRAVEAVLRPEQCSRLHQIRLQKRGILALEETQVQKRLSLTRSQKNRIRAFAEEYHRQMEELAQSRGRAATRQRDTLSKETMDRALALLSDEQRRSWRELRGETFDVDVRLPPIA